MNQLDMFGASAPEVAALPTAETVRPRLVEALELLRSTQDMPWTLPELRRWQVVFPQMTNWLPSDERAAMRAEFASLLGRFGV